jgi:hypothetical protein
VCCNCEGVRGLSDPGLCRVPQHCLHVFEQQKMKDSCAHVCFFNNFCCGGRRAGRPGGATSDAATARARPTTARTGARAAPSRPPARPAKQHPPGAPAYYSQPRPTHAHDRPRSRPTQSSSLPPGCSSRRASLRPPPSRPLARDFLFPADVMDCCFSSADSAPTTRSIVNKGPCRPYMYMMELIQSWCWCGSRVQEQLEPTAPLLKQNLLPLYMKCPM